MIGGPDPQVMQDFACAYIDNIIISSSSWPEHFAHFQWVLQVLKKSGLKANPQKSNLGFQELKYLGYLISCGCLKPLLNKVLMLDQHPRLVSKKHLQQILGFVSYYS